MIDFIKYMAKGQEFKFYLTLLLMVINFFGYVAAGLKVGSAVIFISALPMALVTGYFVYIGLCIAEALVLAIRKEIATSYINSQTKERGSQ